MSSEVYSAAKAVTLRKGKTQQEVWHELIKMFSLTNGENRKVKTFIYGGNPFEEKVKSLNGSYKIGVGDIFKAVSSRGNAIYVTITNWNPFDSFSYEEKMWPSGEARPSDSDRTDFNLIEHPEGTVIEIVRREKADLKKGVFDHLWGRKKDSNNWAAFRLSHILSGGGVSLRNKESTNVNGYTITRDDSLRMDF